MDGIRRPEADSSDLLIPNVLIVTEDTQDGCLKIGEWWRVAGYRPGTPSQPRVR